MSETDLFPVAQPVNSTTPPNDPLQLPDPMAGLVPMPDISPRAVSVAGPLPNVKPNTAAQSSAPPIVQQSGNPGEVMDYLRSMPSDQGFDTAVALTKGDLYWPLQYFKGFTPDQAAAVQKLARENGTTFDVANAGKEDLQSLSTARSILNSLSATDTDGNPVYPNTVKWLTSDPANLATSKDDVDTLASIEQIVKQRRQAGESALTQTVRGAAANMESGVAKFFRLPGMLTEMVRNTQNQQPLSQTQIDQPSFTLRNPPPSTPETPLPDWLTTWFGNATAMEQQADSYDAATTQGRTIQGDYSQGRYGGAAQLGLINLAGAIPTLAASLIDPDIGVVEGAGSAAGSQYKSNLDSGEAPANAAAGAYLTGLINAAGLKTYGAVGQLERMTNLFSTPVARESTSAMWGRIVRQTALSGTQAAATQAAIQAGSDAANYAAGDKTALDDEASKAAVAGILGFVTDGALTVPLGALRGLRQIADQQEGSNWWSKLTGAVDQSKLKGRDPDSLADFINQNLESTGKPTTVNVDADKVTTFFQDSPSDLNKFASDMGTTPEAINDAAASGSTIDLPIGQYQAKYAGTPLDNAIQQHIRFSTGGLSAAELADQVEQLKQTQQMIKAELQRTASEGEPLPTQIDAMRKLLMADKAKGGKGYTADQADSQLAVLLAGIKHSVAQPGESVSAALDRIGLTLHTDTAPEAVGAKPDAKGAIEFGPGKTAIHLFKNSDLSTFLHETSHLFIRQRQDLIDRGLASDQAKADQETLHQFVGVQPGEKPNQEQTEKMVRSFESYLREGKAPSVELSGAFARFRNWLTSIYRSLRALGTAPSHEVREVFDRMLASEDDIAYAQEYYSRKGELLDLIKADEKEKQEVRKKLASVQKTELEKQVKAYLKSYLQAIGGASEIRRAAKEAVDAQPIYQAIETAKDGKIDEDSLLQSIGAAGLKEFTDKFPNLVKKDGAHTLETLAWKHNFQSPESLAHNLLAAVPKAEAVKNYTSRLIAEKEQQLRDEITKNGATPADGAMHTEGSLAYLIAETNLMAKQLEGRPRPIDAKVVRDAARDILSNMPVKRAIRYSDFARTEARLAKQTIDLARKGQWEDRVNEKGERTDGALTARRKQLIQHALVQEAIKARDEYADILRRYSPSRLEPRLSKVESQYVDPVREILYRYGLSDVAPSAPFDLGRVNDLDKTLFAELPTWIVRGENAGDYRNLSWQQLQDVDGAAQAVTEFGNDTLKSNLAAEEKTVAELAAKSIASISQLRTRNRRQLGGGKGLVYDAADQWAKAVRLIDWVGSHLTKFQFIARRLDNFSEQRGEGAGVMTRIWHAMREGEKNPGDAQVAFYERAKRHMETLAEAAKRLRDLYGDRFSVAGVDKPAAYAEDGEMNWSPEELIAYLMNTGSEGNITALKNSFGHDTIQFDRVARLFSAKELKALDGIRSALDTLFEGLNETNFKLYNRRVEKVEAVPQDLTDNEGNPVHLGGGYWPLMFDRRINDRRGLGDGSDADVLHDQTRAMIRAAKPQDGFTKSRVVGHALAPRLDMGVLTDHVDNVTRFTHLAPTIRDANRLMTSPAWREAAVAKMGEAEYQQMLDWLRYQANPRRKASDDLNRGIDQWLARARTLGTKSAMGLNLLSFLKWRSALINGAAEIGWKYIARGYGDAGLRGLSTSTLGLTSNELWKEMVSKSNVLGPREEHGVRDLRQDVDNLKWDEASWSLPFTRHKITANDLKGVLYAVAKAGDRSVVFPVWRGAYIKYMETMAKPEMTDQERDKAAISYADDVIQASQPASLNVDLSSVHRNGNEIAKLLTMFSTYPVTLSNRFRGHYEAYRNGAISLSEFVSKMTQEGVVEPLARAFITAAWYGTLPTAAALFFAPMTNAVETTPVASVVNAIWKGDPNELSPALDFFKLEENLRNDLRTGKDAMHIGWDIARLAGYVTGAPLANLAKPILNWIAAANGEKNDFR